MHICKTLNSQRNQMISFQPVSDGYILVKEFQLTALGSKFACTHVQLQLGLEDNVTGNLLCCVAFVEAYEEDPAPHSYIFAKKMTLQHLLKESRGCSGVPGPHFQNY